MISFDRKTPIWLDFYFILFLKCNFAVKMKNFFICACLIVSIKYIFCIKIFGFEQVKDPTTNCSNEMDKFQVQLDSCFSGTVDTGNLTVINMTMALWKEDDPAQIKKKRQSLFETMCCVIEQAKICAKIVMVNKMSYLVQ